MMTPDEIDAKLRELLSGETGGNFLEWLIGVLAQDATTEKKFSDYDIYSKTTRIAEIDTIIPALEQEKQQLEGEIKP